MGHPAIGSIGVDLIPAELGLGKFTGYNNCSSCCIHLNGVVPGLRFAKSEQFPEHFDDIFVSMLIVVEKHDIVQGRVLMLAFFLELRNGSHARHTFYIVSQEPGLPWVISWI